jgi:hypothetical protein
MGGDYTLVAQLSHPNCDFVTKKQLNTQVRSCFKNFIF